MQTPHESGLTCIHAEVGLCERCEAEYRYDPSSWIEYGDHPQGINDWLTLRAEMLDAENWPAPSGPVTPDHEVPL